MFNNLQQLIAEMATAADEVAFAAQRCLAQEHIRQLNTLISINKFAKDLSQRLDKTSADWINRAIGFLYEEFVSQDEYSAGSVKYRMLEKYSQLLDPVATAHATAGFKRFRDLYQGYAKWKQEHLNITNACVMITALPLEFRAVVRRLQGILSVDAIREDSPATIKVNEPVTPVDAFQWAFDQSRDDRLTVEPDGSIRRQRPFWLVLEGLVANGSGTAKVTVVLLPGYGDDLAQKGIAVVEKKIVPYREVLVVGVAGRLVQPAEMGIGDIVVSSRIFDGSLRKEVPDPRGRTVFINKDNPYDFGPPTFAGPGWLPQPHEPLPSTRTTASGYYGYKRVAAGDVVSGSSLSKASQYKRLLLRDFPTCKAIEMEALGCCVALSGKHLPVRVIKALCDKSDFTKSKRWQPYCADVAAAFARDYVLTLYGAPRESTTK